MKYRKKPVIIDAVIFDGVNQVEIAEFIAGATSIGTSRNELEIHTLEGVMKASKGDYIIKGVKGEFYPCKPDVFKLTYEEINQD